MNVLLTGAFGNVGQSTLEELVKTKHTITVFDLPTKQNLKLSKKYEMRFLWGDITKSYEVRGAVTNQDVVIHTAAMIPPQANRQVKQAYKVNVQGTKNVVNAIEKNGNNTHLLYTSSVAVYGNRLENPIILLSDEPAPNPTDEYAKQKIIAEEYIRQAGISNTIFRLSAIVSDTLKTDPLMFAMPLDTRIEICHTKDVGTALTNAVTRHHELDELVHIAGGEDCRMIYDIFLDYMFESLGFGSNFLPAQAFSEKGYHCGFMTTAPGQEVLQYQNHSAQNYFDEIKKKKSLSRPLMYLLKYPVRRALLQKSPYYQSYKKKLKNRNNPIFKVDIA